MVEAIRNTLLDLRDAAAWLPADVVGIVILAIAAVVALSIDRLVVRTLSRYLSRRHPYLSPLLARTEYPMRLAVLLVALFIALPAAPFDPAATSALTKLLVLASIVLIGWTVITAANTTAELYLLRLRLDVEDNLLARKHIT